MAALDFQPPRMLGLAFTIALMWCALLMASVGSGVAAELPTPSGEVVLSISGNIENHNRKSSEGENVLELDMPMLQALESHSFQTETPWTEGKTKFEGVTLRALLAYAGAGSSDFKVAALDDYSIKITGLDSEKYPVIVAYAKNDKPMSVRQLGPLWIMYPFDDFPELLNEKNKAGAVWQLVTMVVL